MVSIFGADEPIHSGDLIYEISYAGIEGQPAIFHHALSEETLLPVHPGSFLLTHTELLPPVTPPVSITLSHNIYMCARERECALFAGTIYRFIFSI